MFHCSSLNFDTFQRRGAASGQSGRYQSYRSSAEKTLGVCNLFIGRWRREQPSAVYSPRLRRNEPIPRALTYIFTPSESATISMIAGFAIASGSARSAWALIFQELQARKPCPRRAQQARIANSHHHLCCGKAHWNCQIRMAASEERTNCRPCRGR